MQTAAELLQFLIRIPSVNPAHAVEAELTGEKRMADALEALLRDRGMSVTRLEQLAGLGPERPAIVATAGDASAPHSLLVEVHLDTVGVANMTLPPFEGYEENGRIYGRGACDMKGSIAAFLTALTPDRVQALCARGVRLIVVGAPDEECGTKGAMQLAAAGIRAEDALVLEPTRCQPVIAHKGACWYEILLKGRSGHGSQPEKGVSTNEALARLLPELLRSHKALQQMYPHPLLGQSTLNIGRISGGHTFNIIPDQTLVQLDRRVVPNEPPELFEQSVRHMLEECIREGRLLDGKFGAVNLTPAFATPAEAPLVRQLQQAIQRQTGSLPAPLGTSWVSDAAQFGRVCGATVVFGPGDIAQAHTEDEWISLESLTLGTQIFADFLDHYPAAP